MSLLNTQVRGIAAAIEIANLDTDQIMPKQFLHGIDKAGLDKGLLWDLRFTGDGQLRPEFVLNRPEYTNTRILVSGPNFGCGSSREHAVWGLQPFGIQAVIASAYGEIFYSNAMNNRLLTVLLEEAEVQMILREGGELDGPLDLKIDVLEMIVYSPKQKFSFTMSERHRNMFLQGQDMIGASLDYKEAIISFAAKHWVAQPWVKDVASRTTHRLDPKTWP